MPERTEGKQASLRGKLARRLSLSLAWWYRVSAPAPVPEISGFEARERARLGHVASLLILGLVCGVVLLVPIIVVATPDLFQFPLVMICSGLGIPCCLLAIPLNRRNRLNSTALLLILAADITVAGVVLGEKEGLNTFLLSTCDLLVIGELIAVALLPPASVFVVALLNIGLIALATLVQPASLEWTRMVSSPQLTFFVIARSALLFLVVAGLAYLWMSTISQALRRADRAEFIAELEWRERARQQDMEEAVQVILNVHTRIANGDLDARVPTHEHHLLWQVGVALNNLLTRFKSTSQSERTLQRVVQEIAMLRAALREHQGGQALRWYPTEKNILQPLSDDLGRALSQRIAFPAPSARPAPTTGSPLMTPSWSNPVVQAAPPQFPIAMPTPVAQRAPQQFPISLPGPAGQTVPQFPIAMPDSPEALGKADDTLFMPTDPMMRGILS